MSLDLGNVVWKREDESAGPDVMSRRAYISAVTGFTVYGVVLASIIAYLCMSWRPTSIIPVLVIGLVIPIIGVVIAVKSEQWLVSLFGYTLVVVGLGVLLGPTVAMYKFAVVMTAFAATAGVTVVMSVVGILIPKSLEHWGGYLFAALLAFLFVRIGQSFMIGMGVPPTTWYMPIIEYAGAIIFSLYIIYDWNRAVNLPHTLDNAIDCAMAIFLDIINLFIIILRALGSRSSSSD